MGYQRWQVIVALIICFSDGQAVHGAGWRAGLARHKITPEQPLWLAGYGNRDHPAEGKLHDLWVKSLALEDAQGRKVVLVTSDLCGIPKWMDEQICQYLERRHGLKRDQIRLTYSHNHCAPVVRGDLEDYYPLDEAQQKLVAIYSDWLAGRFCSTIDLALQRLAPATLEAGVGICTFAVNRRANKESEVPAILARHEKLQGPVDHSVPVLSVRDTTGKQVALVFAYACHNTVLSFYQWCGDFAGFAQIALEKEHPGMLAMYVNGCGGDQNPLPRRSVALAEKYGQELAQAVDQVLAKPMHPLEARLRTAFEFVPLEFERNPTRAELEGFLKSPNAIRVRWARRMLQHLDRGNVFARSYPYAVQAWMLGDQLWISLGGEALVDYSLKFKRRFGVGTWVTSYFADLTAYLPSERNWREGGYESTNLYEYGHPADRWARDVEDRVTEAVERVVHRLPLSRAAIPLQGRPRLSANRPAR